MTEQRLSSAVPKAASVLADELRRHILVSRLPVGAPLPGERQLIEETGFGRGVVREGLRLLESEGIIRIKRGPHGGISVTRPDTRQITHSLALLLALSEAPLRQLFAFRLVVEPAAATLAATDATAEQRSQLTDSAGWEPDRAIGHNVEFHILLAEATNNEFYRAALTAIFELTHWQSVEDELREADLRAAAQGHRRIAEHIAAGDAARAERAMRRHIATFQQIMDDMGRLDSPVVRPADWSSGGALARPARRIG